MTATTIKHKPRNAAFLRAPAGLALLVLVAFFPVVSGTRSFFHLDLRYEHLPVWSVVQKALLKGESPFWLDGEYCGHPLLFVQEAPVFYPLQVPLLLTGASVGRLADLFSLFHFWLAGVAALFLLKELGADDWSAAASGAAWMLCARLVQSAVWPNAVAVSALLPFLLAGIHRITHGRRRSGILIAAVAGGLALLAARPQVLVAAAPLLVLVAGGWVLRSRQRLPAAADVLLSGLLAAAIGSASLLPAVLLHPEMSRAGGLDRLARDVRPLSLGDGLDMALLPVDRVGRWPEAAAYAGVLVTLAFFAGLVLAVRRAPGFSRGTFILLSAGGLLGLAFAFGEKGPYGLLANLPLVRGFRLPIRFLLCWSLALALGAGLVLSWWVRRSRRPRLAGAIAFFLIAIDLVWHARRAGPTDRAGLDAIEPDVSRQLRRDLIVDETGFPRRFWSVAEKINLLSFAEGDRPTAARELDPLFFALGMRFGLESVNGAGPALSRTETLFARQNPRAMDLAGVGCLVVSSPGPAPAPARVVARPAFPRAILVAQTIPVDENKAVGVSLAPQLDLRQVAIVETPEALLREPASTPAGTVRLLARRPSYLELETQAPGDRFLVVFDAFEQGWDAEVDGRPSSVFRTDGAFRGVRVPAGTHRVRQVYRPRGLKEGLGLSLAGLFGLVLVARRVPADSAQTS